MTDVLTADAVHLTYPGAGAPALADVDLSVAAGECVALLGPNGAGKTTLVSCATGLLAPDRGRVRIAGGDPRRGRTRQAIGVVLQDAAFPRHLTAHELVVGAAVRAGVPRGRATAVLAEVGLADLARRRSRQLSGGQRQRLQLARALAADPALLVLDEPTVGLDAASRRAFWDALAARRDAGLAILLTTHGIEEAGAVADRVVVLAGGRVVADARPAELAARLPDRTLSAVTAVAPAAVAALPGVLSATSAGGRLQVVTPDPEGVLRVLLDRDPDLRDLRVEGASLEDAVLALSDAGPTTTPAAATPMPARAVQEATR